MIRFERIAACFDKHKSIHGKYSSPRGSFLEAGEIAIKMADSTESYTILTTGSIEGRYNGKTAKEFLTNSLSYIIVDSEGRAIDNKNYICNATGVLINGRSLFWVPNDAIFAFVSFLKIVNRIGDT